MNDTVKMKGQLLSAFRTPVLMSILLIAADVVILVIHWPSGLIMAAALLIYLAVVLTGYFRSRQNIIHELVSFATEYGQIQKQLLRELDIPYAVLDDGGHLIWMNDRFSEVTHREKNYHKSITTLFPSIKKDSLPTDETPQSDMSVEFENSNYSVVMKRVSLEDLINDTEIIEATDYRGALIALYLFNETATRLAIQEVDDQSLVVGYIYIDNYDEALDSVEDVRRSLLVALIDRKVTKYVSACDGLCIKTEKDKYQIILRKKSLRDLQEGHFSLLADVKTVSIGNEIPVTISIGIGVDALSYAQCNEFARNAIDMALGRGGDQAVVKTPENMFYYGGKTQQVEKNTRVKARVKAEALKEIIAAREAVYIMGHRLGDADSFGAAMGVYRIARTLDRPAHIVINETSSAVGPMIARFRNNPEYPDDLLVNSQQAIESIGEDTALVVVDVNRPGITECPELLKMCKSIVVLDHHRQGSEVIENATLSYIEAYASSACEMVSEILQYVGNNIKIRPEEADALYSGIVLDTNNFVSKTGVRTFEAAAFLRRSGADVTRVRKLFREDAEEYKAKADAVSQAEIYRGSYAISTCSSTDLQNPTVIGAQAANELLNIRGVKGSFVLTEFQNQIFISARSIDEVNVQIIMERLGGGGHMSVAGCQMEDVSLAEAIGVLKHTIDTLIEEGEL